MLVDIACEKMYNICDKTHSIIHKSRGKTPMNKNLFYAGLKVLLTIGVLISLAAPYPTLAQTPVFPEAPDDVDGLPVADDQAVSTPEDTMVVIHLTASDPDEDPLTWAIVSGPTNGVLNGNPPTLNYTPNPNFHGNDSFTFKVNDAEGESNLATVSITVTAVNDVPLAVADLYDAAADVVMVVNAASGVLANDSDPDSSSLTAVLISTAAHGVLLLRADGGFTYNPDDGYSGVDTFTYMASDGSALSEIASVTISVNILGNTPPVAVANTYEVETGSTLTVDAASGVLANDSDADGDPLTAQLVGETTPYGTLTLNPDGSFVYTPNAGYVGADHFVYQAFDGQDVSIPVMVTINVNALNNTAPIAVADVYQMQTGTTLTVDALSGVLANDSDTDGDTLTAQLVGVITVHGTLTFNADGSFVYTPSLGYMGEDQFVYQAFDGLVASAPVLVTIQVDPVTYLYLPLLMK
jgi:VCBS repeat-containing protein